MDRRRNSCSTHISGRPVRTSAAATGLTIDDVDADLIWSRKVPAIKSWWSEDPAWLAAPSPAVLRQRGNGLVPCWPRGETLFILRAACLDRFDPLQACREPDHSHLFLEQKLLPRPTWDVPCAQGSVSTALSIAGCVNCRAEADCPPQGGAGALPFDLLRDVLLCLTFDLRTIAAV